MVAGLHRADAIPWWRRRRSQIGAAHQENPTRPSDGWNGKRNLRGMPPCERKTRSSWYEAPRRAVRASASNGVAPPHVHGSAGASPHRVGVDTTCPPKQPVHGEVRPDALHGIHSGLDLPNVLEPPSQRRHQGEADATGASECSEAPNRSSTPAGTADPIRSWRRRSSGVSKTTAVAEAVSSDWVSGTRASRCSWRSRGVGSMAQAVLAKARVKALRAR